MNTENIIKASALSVLNQIVRSMIEHCFLLSYEKELSFLKDIVPARSIGEYDDKGLLDWSADLVILDIVEDQPVVSLMNMIRKIQHHIQNYAKNNDLIWEEVATNYYVMEQSTMTWLTIIGNLNYESYSDILDSLGSVIGCYGMLIWNLAHQQIFGLNDVFLETELEYYAWDGNIDSLKIEDQNALFLLNIYADIQCDAANIEQYKITNNGKV